MDIVTLFCDIDDFCSIYSQGARAVLHYLEHVEARIADAEARVTRCEHSLVGA